MWDFVWRQIINVPSKSAWNTFYRHGIGAKLCQILYFASVLVEIMNKRWSLDCIIINL
jgi:hypothetical protein